jgi:hypothetical protein
VKLVEEAQDGASRDPELASDLVPNVQVGDTVHLPRGQAAKVLEVRESGDDDVRATVVVDVS